MENNSDLMASSKARLNAKLDAISKWHEKIAFFFYLGRLPLNRTYVLIAVCFALLAGFANYQIRATQYQAWDENRHITFLDETPLFSTTDASYFVGLAWQYNETGNALDHYAKRLYPYHKQLTADEPPRDSARDFPLLSVIIATLSPDNSTQSLMKTAHALIPLFAFVMALSVLLAFGAAGFWLEGSVAALGAGLMPAFLVRTSVGRIDTDILNLGFFYAILGLTIFAARAASWRAAIIWIVLASGALNLFFWWYDKAFMGWAFTVGLIWLSFMTHRDWRRTVVLTVIFTVLSGLIFKEFNIGDNAAYLRDGAEQGSLLFPNTLKTITELRVLPMAEILETISGSLLLGLLGLGGLALFAYRHPVIAVVYGPASVFALANFLIGNRAVFYSAPMIWFGIAFLAVMAARLAWLKLPTRLTSLRYGEIVSVSAVILGLLGYIWQDKDIQSYVPNPSFPKEIMNGFSLAKGNLPEGSVIATWWDYGYASMLFNHYNTLHDGGKQTTPVTHYFARAMLAETQAETNAILHMLASGGRRVISENSQSFAQMEDVIQNRKVTPTTPVFLVLTSQMSGWMGSISRLGMWDTKTGTPINAKNSPYGPALFYSNLRCQPGSVSHQAICDDQTIDFQSGTINGQPVIKLLTQAENGVLDAVTSLREDALNHLHLSDLAGKSTQVMLFHDRLARTSFHNLFHLARVDNNYFEMIYDDYPHIRIFAVK